jgi:tryptophan halogenase
MIKIVVAGGGSAGWITALMMQHSFPDAQITLIESSKIGIIGAGEGSTPIVINTLMGIGITLEDLIKNTSSTIKNGSRFVGFNKYKDYYTVFSSIHNPYTIGSTKFAYDLYAFKNKMSFEEYSLIQICTDQNKIKFIESSEGSYAIHFDGRSFSAYLSQVGQSRGIEVVDGIIKVVNLDQNDRVTSLELEDGSLISCDFVFDCTGFKRLIIGNTYKSEWISFAESLPTDRAIPYFLPIDEDIPPYTQATAMDYGWGWKVPLQHRYGCGYVYSSKYITDEEAKQEIEAKLGFKPDYINAIKFDPGVFKEVMIKNCISVGLASSFVEPMEATSISRSVAMVSRAINMLMWSNFNPEQSQIDEFNQEFLEDMNDILDFIYLHYITNKIDNDFWANFTSNNKIPDSLRDRVEKLTTFKNIDYPVRVYDQIGYYNVLYGNGLLDDIRLEKWYNDKISSSLENELNEYRLKYISKSNDYMNHSDFIKKVLNE